MAGPALAEQILNHKQGCTQKTGHAGDKLRDADKVTRIPIRVVAADRPLPKLEWLRIKEQRQRVEALVAETGLVE